ncbi:unnamed protein product, partial [Meganyctiphanes norvegica]
MEICIPVPPPNNPMKIYKFHLLMNIFIFPKKRVYGVNNLNKVKFACSGVCRPKCLVQERDDTSVREKICTGNKVCCVATSGHLVIGDKKQVKRQNSKIENTKSKKSQTRNATKTSKKTRQTNKKLKEKARKGRENEKTKQVRKRKINN